MASRKHASGVCIYNGGSEGGGYSNADNYVSPF
jgi:hypothetical protein